MGRVERRLLLECAGGREGEEDMLTEIKCPSYMSEERGRGEM